MEVQAGPGICGRIGAMPMASAVGDDGTDRPFRPFWPMCAMPPLPKMEATKSWRPDVPGG
jgi:hypothetical protein